MKATIQFDGGCKPNPGQKYGSYCITHDDVFEVSRHQFLIGIGTNNEAEFEALLYALRELVTSCPKAEVDPKQIEVSIFTDSMIVRNWLQKFHTVKVEKIKKDTRRLVMHGLAQNCLNLLSAFKSFTIEWNSRERNVEKFGH